MMLINDNEYFAVLTEAIECIKSSQYNASVGINHALLHRNWFIGDLLISQGKWGNKLIDNLARDIKSEFPNATGFSVRNLKYMKKFAGTFNEEDIDKYGLSGITWYHHIALMDKTSSQDQYLWYAQKTIENGWSHDVLVHQIEYNLFDRQNGEKVQNFEKRLPEKQSDLAVQTMKDPYIFDFVQMRDQMKELDIERELVRNVTKLLLELGTGFAFVGEQYQLKIQEQEFRVDLLFYNTKLHCYIAVDLKTGKFVPEYAGKMNFYLSALDDLVKSEYDNPSIGLIICKDKNKMVAEYALKDMSKPIGVSEYRLLNDLPDELRSTLPSVEDIETRVFNQYGVE